MLEQLSVFDLPSIPDPEPLPPVAPMPPAPVQPVAPAVEHPYPIGCQVRIMAGPDKYLYEVVTVVALAPAEVRVRVGKKVIALPPEALRLYRSPAIEWWEGQAAYYLRLMVKVHSGELPPEVKTYEFSRLHELRQQALQKLETLNNG